ncbi:hypothetical protein TcasGA2_TC008550 [Tribolium castaneum]|uniref:Uncharacterized protein n=1 Tax=Tribolium castaneum TaxID=7070 RepID=D7EI89_TRICA|nr:hypothetical protein TcasGA2_TC008550 [Tribolium castaneum]
MTDGTFIFHYLNYHKLEKYSSNIHQLLHVSILCYRLKGIVCVYRGESSARPSILNSSSTHEPLANQQDRSLLFNITRREVLEKKSTKETTEQKKRAKEENREEDLEKRIDGEEKR